MEVIKNDHMTNYCDKFSEPFNYYRFQARLNEKAGNYKTAIEYWEKLGNEIEADRVFEKWVHEFHKPTEMIVVKRKESPLEKEKTKKNKELSNKFLKNITQNLF